MALETKELVRAFKYNSVELADPGPQFTVEQVKQFYADTYPEIVNATIEGPEQKEDKQVYTFRRAVGTKGDTPPTDPTTEGKRLIERWRDAGTAWERAKSGINSAECELKNSATELGKWMVPDDAKDGEKFCIWYGDSLIQVEYKDQGYSIRVRTRGKRGI